MDHKKKVTEKPLVYRKTLVQQVKIVQVHLNERHSEGQISKEFWQAATVALKVLVDILMN
jgi:hypothetical protein